MKALIVVASAAVLAFPAYAQQKADLPSAKERAQNREQVEKKLPTADERARNREQVEKKLPTADERAQNREKAAKAARSATLTGKVKSALAADDGLKTLKIDVDSNEGVVTLKGHVKTAEAKKRAGEIAKQVEGVKSVKNQLRVEAPKP